MAETFNLNNFLQTYKTQTYDPTKQHAAAEEKMEEKLQQQAQEAVQQSGFLTLTLSEKMAEMGIGERALKQFADTATGLLTDVVSPLGDYLKISLTREFIIQKYRVMQNKCSLHLRLCAKKQAKIQPDKTSYMICRNLLLLQT